DEELVRRAIEREKERGGQAFFLHNRVNTLHETAERLRALCPGVRFAEAHGQMDESDLEQAMLEFLRGDADCLVATTIIESGLDIPQANTLIVERSDELGLAQAYQIRGRVGRWRARAGRAARPWRRAARPVRASAEARREPARAPAGADRAGRPRGPYGRVPGRASVRDPAGARRGRGRAPTGGHPGGDVRVAVED